MKSFLYLWVALTSTTFSLRGAPWLTDHGTAVLRRSAENKPMLILFTGSDWCPACQELRRSVFVQPEFVSYARANLILLEVDFPKSRPMSVVQKQSNQALAKAYRVTHYPTMVLVDTKGVEAFRIQYNGGTAKGFVADLDDYVRQITPRQITKAPSKTPQPPEPAEPPPMFSGAPTTPLRLYSDLTLKAITGTKGRRFALLNNQTFAAGDTAKVKLENREVKVHCVEVREKSVVVAVEGQPGQREIALAGTQ